MPASANSSWKPRSPRTVLSMEKILLVRHCALEPDHALKDTKENEGQLKVGMCMSLKCRNNAFWTQIYFEIFLMATLLASWDPNMLKLKSVLFLPGHFCCLCSCQGSWYLSPIELLHFLAWMETHLDCFFCSFFCSGSILPHPTHPREGDGNSLLLIPWCGIQAFLWKWLFLWSSGGGVLHWPPRYSLSFPEDFTS